MVQRACSSTGTFTSLLLNVIHFRTSIANMYFSNAKVDVVFALSEKHHFDDETFQAGRDVITAGTHHWFCTKDVNNDTKVLYQKQQMFET